VNRLAFVARGCELALQGAVPQGSLPNPNGGRTVAKKKAAKKAAKKGGKKSSKKR
jgi:hypothetical protein